ncbi:MAG: SDR family NAD(P)-dependent oxidoreductase [Puniceicoccaceae bacterium]|nr:MAG: SDR family NAD(P)-dependent oxidoreductase [Puniceicoccaceae bacterium]
MTTGQRQAVLHDFSRVVISGGSSGIGKQFIEQALSLEPGPGVCNLSRRPPEVADAGKRLEHLSCDLADPDARKRVFSALAGRVECEDGPLLVVNNAGFGAYGAFPEPETERHLAMLAVNVAAPVELTARLLPALRRRGGAVINVASTAAFQPTPHMATYGASKAFLLHWSLALHQELRAHRIPVIALCPGPTRTHFFREAGFETHLLPEGISQDSDAVVATALKALAKGRPLIVSGWTNRLTAGVSSTLPKRVSAWLAGRIIGRFRLGRHPARPD